MKIARLIGSAGSGKTTELIKIMEGARSNLSVDPMAIGMMSFTRAARQEVAERASAAWNMPVSMLTRDGYIRTGHSICYRQLGVSSGQLITDKKADMEWLVSKFGVNLKTAIDDDSSSQVYIGDEVVAWCLNAWNLHRVSLTPLEEVVARLAEYDEDYCSVEEVQMIAEKYETAKRIDERYDYNDLLLRFAGISCSPKYGISRVEPEGSLPPVRAWLFDEQQDASPLLDAVCKRLVSGPLVKWCYVVGDPFQAIYGFAGSSASCFLGWKADKEKIMPKSYRCPAPILRLGEECLRKMSPSGGYFDRGVEPASHEGEIVHRDDIEDLGPILDANEDWLLIARTNYQAGRFLGYCASAGIPARSVRAPADPTIRQRGLAALCRLEQNEHVTGQDWAAAVTLLPAKNKSGQDVLERGAKKRWKDKEEASRWDIIFSEDMKDIGATDYLSNAVKSGEWQTLVEHGQSWRRSAKKYGIERAMKPNVRVGTIHSVKGMEADNVAVLTTTSKKVQVASLDTSQHDEECRIAYVAVTRARRRLVIINEGGFRTPRMEALS